MEKKTRKMKITKTTVVLACLLLALGSATALGREWSQESEDDGCKQIKATLVAAPVTEDCTSPLGCFAGVITGNALLSGTSFASLTGVAASAGLPGIEPPTTLSYTGVRTIVTSHGVLTFSFVGVVDTTRGALGEVAEMNRVSGGTGRFEGATGTLWVTVSANATVAQVTGQICMNKP